MRARNATGQAIQGKQRGNQRLRWMPAARPVSLLACIALLAACVSKAVPEADRHDLTQQISTRIAELAGPADGPYCTEPGAKTLASVVRVASPDGNDASGVVIADNRVLTAAHVITTATRALVFINDNYRDAEVLVSDTATDLAILAVETEHLQPIRISRQGLLQEEPVWTVGFPLALDQVANPGFYQHHVNGAIYASASTNAGASGGGLLRCADGRFELAGMIRGYGAYWRGGELLRIKDLSISVPADTISEFASQSGVPLSQTSRF